MREGRSQTEKGEGPRGSAAILGSQGRPRVRLRPSVCRPKPRCPGRSEAGIAVPSGLLRGAATAAVPLAAEAVRLALGRAAAAGAGGRSEGDTVPPAATLSSPLQDPAAVPGAVQRACPRSAARCTLQPASERLHGPRAPLFPGWAASGRPLEPKRQKLQDLRSGSYEGSPQGERAENGGRLAVWTARAGDGAEALRALFTGGAGPQARARAGAGSTGRGSTRRRSRTSFQFPFLADLSSSLSWLFLRNPADNTRYRASGKGQLSVIFVCPEQVQPELLKVSPEPGNKRVGGHGGTTVSPSRSPSTPKAV